MSLRWLLALLVVANVATAGGAPSTSTTTPSGVFATDPDNASSRASDLLNPINPALDAA